MSALQLACGALVLTILNNGLSLLGIGPANVLLLNGTMPFAVLLFAGCSIKPHLMRFFVFGARRASFSRATSREVRATALKTRQFLGDRQKALDIMWRIAMEWGYPHRACQFE